MSELSTPQEFAEYVKERYERNPNGSFDRVGKEYISSGKLSIDVVIDEESDLSWSERFLGTGFGSTVDGGERYDKIQNGELSKSELAEEVRKRIGKRPRQINFVKTESREVVAVYTGVVVVVRRGGYVIFPNPEEKVDM